MGKKKQNGEEEEDINSQLGTIMIISVCYCVCSQFALLVESGAPPQFWSLCGNFQKKRKRKKSHRFMSIIYICKNRERKKRTPITNKSQKTNSFFFFLYCTCCKEFSSSSCV